MTLADLFRVVALVLFIIAGVLAFGWVGDGTLLQVLGLDSFGLAAWCLSSFGLSNRPVG